MKVRPMSLEQVIITALNIDDAPYGTDVFQKLSSFN